MPDPGPAGRHQPDPLAERSPLLFWLFGWYLRWFFWRNFNAVRVTLAGLPQLPPGRPVILFTNHPSWWDPALFILLATTRMRGRIGFGPMEQAALGRYGLLRKMGVFGIALDHPRGAARFLEVSARVLADPRAVLFVTAEGHFTDARTRPVHLRPGIAHLARRNPDAVLVPMAVEYSFWNERRPEALVAFGAPILGGRNRSVAAWTGELETALTATMDALAAASARRDPALFALVARGSGGVGGVYDLWRGARAWLRGEPARLRHEEPAP